MSHTAVTRPERLDRAIPIGGLSERTGVKVETIRYYEQVGLLPPPERSDGNQRRYTRRHLERLAFIKHARDLGFSVDSIRTLLTSRTAPIWLATKPTGQPPTISPKSAPRFHG